MKERPILFSAPMVRAILEGRKTQTRRVVKPQGAILTDRMARGLGVQPPPVQNSPVIPCPYGQPGDRLWVRETWGLHSYGDETNWLSASGTAITKETLVLWDIAYRADFGPMQDDCYWRPSIHMPRWASRILLEVTGVRVEQLNEISEADAKAEGAMFHDGRGIGHSGWRHDYKNVHANARSSFARLWESINGPGSWEANPFVWVIEFKRIDNA